MAIRMWMRQGVLAAALALGALSGCSDATEEGAVGQVSQAANACVVESCQAPTPYFNQELCACAPCELDEHCPEGATCDAAGQCVATLECESPADCAQGEVCEAGRCREGIDTDGTLFAGDPEPENCDPNDPSSCEPGEVCNQDTLVCEVPASSCTNSPCHPELTCGALGLCEGCTDGIDARCPNGSFCFSGMCLQL
ncbi:hypothetical protein FRC98_14315 [Lujinxingia vulgaris]|uniref:Uncharacterized protein n=1 Tax=Lujinxingia vulgaris TaxID=2600176 RepID=A0A5C6XAP8_9DELT|nr:hypothetical protein [Lujinxingia vulgaris]TXD35846.1 hypothetical protein FRC98_14315 [Lujinxingia vulgaris]